MLFEILNSEKEMVSCGLDVYQVHYMFVEKKVDRKSFFIRDSEGLVMPFKKFVDKYLAG